MIAFKIIGVFGFPANQAFLRHLRNIPNIATISDILKYLDNYIFGSRKNLLKRLDNCIFARDSFNFQLCRARTLQLNHKIRIKMRKRGKMCSSLYPAVIFVFVKEVYESGDYLCLLSFLNERKARRKRRRSREEKNEN